MSSLIPGQALIYERADGIVYARYRDAPHNTIPRWVVGGEVKLKDSYKVWIEINEKAKTNKVLQDALERVILLYQLSKDDSDG